jgi:regulator of protease activity HflC (stomatin/prohibitin superfamily)
MESALGWIGDLVTWLVSWFPHLVVINKTHGGVKFVRGWKTKVLEPGMHWYWPITSDIIEIPVVRQSLELAGQTLTCEDGKTVFISVVLVYEIHDVHEALVDTWDFDETIADIAQKCTSVEVSGHPRELMLKYPEVLVESLQESIEDRLTAYGVTLRSVGVVNLAPTRAYRVVTE